MSLEFLERQSPHKIQLILDALDEIRKEEANQASRMTGNQPTNTIGQFS